MGSIGIKTLKSQLRNVGFDVSGEIKDAKSPITIFINQRDIDKGRPSSPMKCTAAQCLQRAIGSKKVAMFNSTAYVQMPAENSITRFIVPALLKEKVVVPQDTGGEPVSGVYTLRPPIKTQRLGEASKRRTKLRDLRKAVLAPPPKKQSVFYSRPVTTRWIATK